MHKYQKIKNLVLLFYHHIPIQSQERWHQSVLSFFLSAVDDGVAAATQQNIISITMTISLQNAASEESKVEPTSHLFGYT